MANRLSQQAVEVAVDVAGYDPPARLSQQSVEVAVDITGYDPPAQLSQFAIEVLVGATPPAADLGPVAMFHFMQQGMA
jgi:hypothetical protein